MAGIKQRGPKSENRKRYYNGEVVKPTRYFSSAEGVNGIMCGLDANGDIIRDEFGKPKSYRAI